MLTKFGIFVRAECKNDFSFYSLCCHFYLNETILSPFHLFISLRSESLWKTITTSRLGNYLTFCEKFGNNNQPFILPIIFYSHRLSKCIQDKVNYFLPFSKTDQRSCLSGKINSKSRQIDISNESKSLNIFIEIFVPTWFFIYIYIYLHHL